MGVEAFLRKVVREGDLTVKLPGGAELRLGDGSGPPLVCRITSAAWAARMVANPNLGVGEAYMDGGLVLEEGGIVDFMGLLGLNAALRPNARQGPVPRWVEADR